METNDQWLYFTPDPERTYALSVYDDGNQIYDVYVNKWLITGKWRGKRSLINAINPSIKITSISKWKLFRLQ